MPPKKDGIAEILAARDRGDPHFFPGVHVRGTTKGNHGNIHVSGKHCGHNPRFDEGYTPAQSEKIDKQIVEKNRKRAREAKQKRGLSRKGGEELRLVGSIPYSLHQARVNETGNRNYWKEEGEAALKRDNLHFPD